MNNNIEIDVNDDKEIEDRKHWINNYEFDKDEYDFIYKVEITKNGITEDSYFRTAEETHWIYNFEFDKTEVKYIRVLKSSAEYNYSFYKCFKKYKKIDMNFYNHLY